MDWLILGLIVAAFLYVSLKYVGLVDRISDLEQAVAELERQRKLAERAEEREFVKRANAEGKTLTAVLEDALRDDEANN